MFSISDGMGTRNNGNGILIGQEERIVDMRVFFVFFGFVLVLVSGFPLREHCLF